MLRKRRIMIILHLIPMLMFTMNLFIGSNGVDKIPPQSMSRDVTTSNRSHIIYASAMEYIIPTISVHTEDIRTDDIIMYNDVEEDIDEDIDSVEDVFLPIGEYYDNIKNGNMSFDGDLQEYLWWKCEENGVDFYIIMAQICEESEYKETARGHNTNGTVDKGLAQINSKYLGYFEELMGRSIDPYNPYDAIDWIVFFHGYEKPYWISNGYNNNDADMAVLGSYNKGRNNMKSYINKHGLSYYYNDNIISRSKQLMEEHYDIYTSNERQKLIHMKGTETNECTVE